MPSEKGICMLSNTLVNKMQMAITLTDFTIKIFVIIHSRYPEIGQELNWLIQWLKILITHPSSFMSSFSPTILNVSALVFSPACLGAQNGAEIPGNIMSRRKRKIASLVLFTESGDIFKKHTWKLPHMLDFTPVTDRGMGTRFVYYSGFIWIHEDLWTHQ